MRRGRIFIYLALIIILGLAAVVIIGQRFLAPQPTAASTTPVPTPVEMVDVIVVTQRIPRGSVLDENALGMIPVQRDLFIQGMFTNMNEVKGKLARFDLDAGIPLTSGMLVDSAETLSSTGSVAALSIPRGMVAVSIPINRLSSVSYAPRPGDHVNVIMTMNMVDLDPDFQTLTPNLSVGVVAPGVSKLTGGAGQSSTNSQGGEQDKLDKTVSGTAGLEVESSSLVAVNGGGGSALGRPEIDAVLGQTFYVVPSEIQRPRMVTQNLLQDAIVLQMGDFKEEEEEIQAQEQLVAQNPQLASDGVPPEQANPPIAQNEEPAPEPKLPEFITLIVTPQDAITLNYLIYNGAQLTIALRAAGDDSRIQTEAVTLQFLLDQYNIPVPAKLPYGPEKMDPVKVSEPTPVP